MALIRWNPWNLPSVFDEDWDLPTVPGISRMLGQGLNIYETEQEIIAEVALPGIPEDKIDVSIEEGVVRISATNEARQEDSDKRRYFMSNLSSSYNYSFRLPEGIASDQEPEATLAHGVLKLNFKKVQQAAPKKIKVKSLSQSSSTPKKIEAEVK